MSTRLRTLQEPEADWRRRGVPAGLAALSDEVAEPRQRWRGLWAGSVVLTAIGSFGLVWGLLALSPWPPQETVRHIASFPSCEIARELGVAPAMAGQPGYWRRHDPDRDGVSCEPWAER